ncbi:MAG TPA: helix-turn-helix domain-containing protein [Acidiferrobacterales bacterium]|nr:helix-turn-helix domain-containing protein [Acidiferrobacterales bacterium]
MRQKSGRQPGPVEPTYSHKHKSYFTRAEVAELLEVSPNTVSRWVRGGKIPSVLTPGGRRRYPVEAITRLVQEFQQADPLAPSAEQQR